MVVASIEAPLALFQKPVKILLLNAIEFAQMPLGLVPEVLDAIDVILPLTERPAERSRGKPLTYYIVMIFRVF